MKERIDTACSACSSPAGRLLGAWPVWLALRALRGQMAGGRCHALASFKTQARKRKSTAQSRVYRHVFLEFWLVDSVRAAAPMAAFTRARPRAPQAAWVWREKEAEKAASFLP
jgi:hypothetical protein